MKSLADLQRLVSDRIERHWAESLLAEVHGQDDPFWPWTQGLTTLNGHALNDRWSEVWRWIVDWNTWSEANRCPLTTANRRIGGTTRAIPARITIPDIDIAAATSASDWPRRLIDSRRRAGTLHEHFPTTLTSGLLRNACSLSDIDFDLAISAADWFRQHDATGLTARQVPIAGLHAKWIDSNTRLITGLSGRTALGLIKRPSRVHYSYLDRHWLQQGNRRRDSISIDEPDQPPGYQPQIILITENKDTALFFPAVDGGIVIEGNGTAVTRLAKIPWIRACPTIVYWGDLDAHGLTILDLLRSTGVPAHAILMDESTLHRYRPYASPTYADGSPLPQGDPAPTPFLSEHERNLLELITAAEWTGPRRIEQERIPLSAALDQLPRLLARPSRTGPCDQERAIPPCDSSDP